MKIRGQQVYTPKERIERKTNIDLKTGCWNWTGAMRCGYGRLVLGSRTDGTRRSESAHRASYAAFIGPVPSGMEVCHHCDNKKCCRPDHLFIGTRQDNVDDREKKGRNNPPRGEAHGRSRLTFIKVSEIRQSNLSSRRLAAAYGVNKSTVLDVRNGRSWIPKPPQGDIS